jgi:DNA invertase Pin-like site-specific DNA recombinase
MEENNENNHSTKAQTKITIGKYTRCSTDNQELKLQNEVIDKYIQRLKEDNPQVEYTIIKFEDFAQSGKSTDRPSFKLMMDEIEKGKINIVIFTKLDRLARSLQDLLNITSSFESKNVKFVVVEQNLDTTTYQGRLLFQIIGAFSEFERNIIRERMENGRKKAEIVGTRSGKPCHRPKVKIDEDGVKYKYKQGKSMHQIAKEYNVSITPIRRILRCG